jgi:hypothetical protein
MSAARPHFFCVCHHFGTIAPDGAEGNGDMRRLRSMLRSAPARIGRRFAELVAIAAASLPAAGA